MKKIILLVLLVNTTFAFVSAQGTFSKIYDLFQQKCVTCHNNTDQTGGLDLQGTGANRVSREISVHGNLVNKTPVTAAAASAKLKRIYPGRPDKSFLFHKINRGLEPTLSFGSNLGEEMPPYGQTQLTDAEKEMIRQWILYGAKSSGTQFNQAVIDDFYAGEGMKSFPDGPPPAPAAHEGFQVKMGPFYLQPQGQLNDELEYFQKYELDLPEDVEVTRINIVFSSFSHHFIIYDFEPNGDLTIPHGLRLNADHSNIGLVAAVQEPTNLELPKGTAFFWDNKLVLDLNSHFINYSATKIYQAETYVNIYTQPKGEALHEMQTDLIANLNIPIPNNGDLITHRQVISPNLGELFIWGVMGHTHKYGRDYKVYLRKNLQESDIFYDASCPQGIPGCSSPFFDYRHIPMRYFEPLMPVTFNFLNGIVHEAKWVNNGPSSVNFGPTSDDEMMVMVLMYTDDTTGLVYTDVNGVEEPLALLSVFPNPAQDVIYVDAGSEVKTLQIELSDLAGRPVLKRMENSVSGPVAIQRNNIPAGVYFVNVTDERGRSDTAKVIFQ